MAVATEQIAALRAAALAQPSAVERASSNIKFTCPQCTTEGHDRHRDNAVVFPDGKWGCAHTDDLAHWDAIGQALGAFTRRNGREPTPTAAPPAAPRPAATAPEADPPYVFTPAFPADHFVTAFITYAAECVDATHEHLETAALILLAEGSAWCRPSCRG